MLIGVVCQAASAENKVPLIVEAPTKKTILDVFDPKEHPGQGALTFKTPSTPTETIELGTAAERYAYGMVFHGSILPEPYRTDLARHTVIQITLGNLGSKAEGKVPQFGMLSLITTEMPTKTRVFRAALPPENLKKLTDQALIQLTSPLSARDRSDEDSLKNTYYSQSGTVTLEPVGPVDKVQIKGPEGLLAFKLRKMKLSFNALLATPFNSVGSDLTGSLQLSLFWPDGKRSESFMKKIAFESLGGGFQAPHPKARLLTPKAGPGTGSRQITGGEQPSK